MKTIYFVAGLPRSGSTMMINILKQNPKVHGEAVSSLAVVASSIHSNWDNIQASKEYPNDKARMGVLRGVFDGYYKHIEKPIIFDKDRLWTSKIGLLEAVTGARVKILQPVRNPAEILSSFEKLRKNNPMSLVLPDQSLGEGSTIGSRCMYYAGPTGAMGLAHQFIRDAITMGYLDRMLFVEYNRFCNSPKSQLKRIYDFFELPAFEHDLEHIVQEEVYNDTATSLPGLHKIKPKLDKTTVNCVEYLGLDLYQQYNREIFWDSYI